MTSKKQQNRKCVIIVYFFQDNFASKRSKQINMCFYLANFVMPVVFVIFALSYFAIGLMNTIIG